MANTYAPFGMRYVGREDGATYTFAISSRPIWYTNSNKIAYGDPVKTISTAGITQGTLDIATTGSQYAGVVIGVQYTDSVLGLVERPAWLAPSTAIANYNATTNTTTSSVIAKFIPDGDASFEIQANGVLTYTSVGLNAGFGGLGNPTTTSGISQAYLDTTLVGTSPTLPLRIIGFSQGIFNGQVNDPTSAYPVVLVTMNNGDTFNTTGV